ncbi:hypothetical protein EYF80_000939 [Liparis tanakae]|uniref:Uncharacterized protein n=1 Tax=Liparis tanakae TaxID=230148 RepID=A0A4Z2JF56_9TELE|nr:hypothetical protein EYF80_000939 [Liparis tanakae]
MYLEEHWDAEELKLDPRRAPVALGEAVLQGGGQGDERHHDTPNVKLLNCPGSTSTTDRAMAEDTRVKEPWWKPIIVSPTASVILRILEGTAEEGERTMNGEDEGQQVAVRLQDVRDGVDESLAQVECELTLVDDVLQLAEDGQQLLSRNRDNLPTPAGCGIAVPLPRRRDAPRVSVPLGASWHLGGVAAGVVSTPGVRRGEEEGSSEKSEPREDNVETNNTPFIMHQELPPGTC